MSTRKIGCLKIEFTADIFFEVQTKMVIQANLSKLISLKLLGYLGSAQKALQREWGIFPFAN